jgi:hypothetical protein
MRGAALLFLLCAGLAVLLPAASLAQSAGDEQYTDPFQEENQPSGGQGGSGGGGGGNSQGTTGGSQDVPTDTGTGSTGDTGDSGSTGDTDTTTGTTPSTSTGSVEDDTASAGATSGSGSAVLPVTGLPAVVPLLLLGAGMLLGGLALRREV